MLNLENALGWLQLAWLMRRPQHLFSALYQMPWYQHMLLTAVAPARWQQQQVVELGCATGELSLALAQAGAQVLAVDRSAQMVQVAARQGFGIQTLRADALALPLTDASFDAAIAASLVNVVAQPRALLREMARVTRPGGQVTVLFPALGFTDAQLRSWVVAQNLRGLPRAVLWTWHRMARKLDVATILLAMTEVGLTALQERIYLGGMVAALQGQKA